MPYRLLLDENLENDISGRLEDDGHDVVHVDSVPDLGKGTDDESIAAYSTETDRLIVTYDDDFVLDYDGSEYRGVIYVADSTLSAREVAEIVHAMSGAIPHEQFQGLEYASESWL